MAIMGRTIGLLALVLSLASCAPPAPPPRTTVNVISDKFSQAITLEGLPRDETFNGNEVFWMLRSLVSPQTHSAQQQIYVEWFFPGHGNAQYFAADDTARPLTVTKILKESCGNKCGQTDTLGIDIDEATLRGRATTGFQVKLSDNSGAFDVLDITPQMIGAQLAAETSVMAGQPVVARPTTPAGKPLLGIAPFDLPFGVGVQVNRVDANTPAEAAGFQVGDLVKSYNGNAVTGADQLRGLIGQTRTGTKVPVEITRHGQTLTLTAQM